MLLYVFCSVISASVHIRLDLIIERLSSKREKLKSDGTNVAQWLQNLAAFTGALFRRYNIELGGLLQFLVYQLRDGKSLDLLVLRELVAKMSGVEFTEDVTDHQLEAQGGTLLLRSEVRSIEM